MPRLIPSVVAAGSVGSRPQPKIPATAALTLKPWTNVDAAFVVRAFSTPDIHRWHFRRYDTVPEAGEWIAAERAGWVEETCASWAVVTSGSDEPVGRVAVHLSLHDGCGEISYWVVPWARRQGFATHSTIAATRWAHELGLHRVQVEHSTENQVSGAVAIRAGFVREGIRRGANLHADGWHDMVLYSHLATDGPTELAE